MTTVPHPVGTATAAAEARAALPAGRVLADIGLIAGRNLRKMLRNSRGSSCSPRSSRSCSCILFAYVFGAVATGGRRHQPTRTSSCPRCSCRRWCSRRWARGVGIANDLHTGMIDRFRSLPIARSAFLLGRTVSDSTRLVDPGRCCWWSRRLLIGFRFHNGIPAAIGMVVVVVLFGIALIARSPRGSASPSATPRPCRRRCSSRSCRWCSPAPRSRRSAACPGGCSRWRSANPVTAAIDLARGLALGDRRAAPHQRRAHARPRSWHFAVWWVAIVVDLHRRSRCAATAAADAPLDGPALDGPASKRVSPRARR